MFVGTATLCCFCRLLDASHLQEKSHVEGSFVTTAKCQNTQHNSRSTYQTVADSIASA